MQAFSQPRRNLLTDCCSESKNIKEHVFSRSPKSVVKLLALVCTSYSCYIMPLFLSPSTCTKDFRRTHRAAGHGRRPARGSSITRLSKSSFLVLSDGCSPAAVEQKCKAPNFDMNLSLILHAALWLHFFRCRSNPLLSGLDNVLCWLLALMSFGLPEYPLFLLCASQLIQANSRRTQKCPDAEIQDTPQ